LAMNTAVTMEFLRTTSLIESLERNDYSSKL
jgi:hypothetical protein